MLLKQTLKLLIDRYGITTINDMIGLLYSEKMDAASEKDDVKMAQYYDELSEKYDEINRYLVVRPYRDDQRKK